MKPKIPFDYKDMLCYMFDISEPYSDNSSIMTCNTFLRFGEIRPLFYKTDLSKLEDFSVIINIHTDGYLGTYIVRNEYVEYPFMNSDDYNVCFTLKEYNERKKITPLTEEYNFFGQLERFKNETIYTKKKYDYHQKSENNIFLSLRTKWNVITFEGKPIALISEKDSWRLLHLTDSELENTKYQKFRVESLEEGIEYIKYFIK